MAKANPKAWFPARTARISYKSVDKWARNFAHISPWFDTWREAHGHMIKKADERLKKASAEFKSATAHRAKVLAMKEPAAATQQEKSNG